MPPSNSSNPSTPSMTDAPQPKNAAHTLSIVQLASVGAVLLIALALGAYYLTGSSKPVFSTSAPFKVGLSHFRQGESAVEGLKSGLANLGYTNVQYIGEEVSVSDPNFMDTIKAQFKKEIEQDHVDILFADHEQQAVVALQVTKELNNTTPIVYIARFHDPVQLGLAASFKSSGNNATGIAQNLVDTTTRNLQFIKEMKPDAHKIGVFGNGFVIPGVGDQYLAEFKKQAQNLGFEIVEYTTDVPPPQAQGAWEAIASKIQPGDIDALIHVPGHFYDPQESAEYALTKRLQIPHSVPVEDMPGGGDFSYSADFRQAGVQAARIVDKILRGAKPADIPIEYGEKSILILNQYRAKESNLTFPDSMLYLADQQITTAASSTTQ